MKNFLFGLTLITTTLAVTACGGSSNNGGPAVGPAVAPAVAPVDSNHQLAAELLSMQSPTKEQIQSTIDQATQNEDNLHRSLTNRYIRDHLRFECQGDVCVVQERNDVRTE